MNSRCGRAKPLPRLVRPTLGLPQSGMAPSQSQPRQPKRFATSKLLRLDSGPNIEECRAQTFTILKKKEHICIYQHAQQVRQVRADFRTATYHAHIISMRPHTRNSQRWMIVCTAKPWWTWCVATIVLFCLGNLLPTFISTPSRFDFLC